MKRIVLAMVAAAVATSCRCEPAREGASLFGGSPSPQTRGPSRNVETVLQATPGVDLTGFGRHLAMVTVPGGEATVAFTARGSLYAARSDRAQHAWLPPMKVGEVAERERPLSLALDRSNGLLAIAYIDPTQQIRVATSKDSGMTWRSERLPPAAMGRRPSIAMAGGRAYMTWLDAAGAHYASGRADDPETWLALDVPTGDPRSAPVVAIDSRGEPGVAWASGAPLDVYFWRPTAPPVVALHTGSASPSWELALAFEGARPRMVLRGSVAGVYGLWALAASDAGRAWPRVTSIPGDGPLEADGPLSLAVSAGGKAALVTQTRELIGGDGSCGWPKLSRSSDFHEWSTCSPIPDSSLGDETPVVAFDAERLIVAVTNPDWDTRPPGIYVWREVTGEAAERPLPAGPLHAARPR